MAGGLNLYGYANADPVNNHDPFGLDVDPKDEKAASVYKMLKDRAHVMSVSTDERRSRAGKALLGMISDLENMDAVLEIHVDLVSTTKTGWLEGRTGSGQGVNLASRDFDRWSPVMLLAHELGHAHHIYAKGNPLTLWDAMPWSGFNAQYRAGVRAENHMRVYYGCTRRWTHYQDGSDCW